MTTIIITIFIFICIITLIRYLMPCLHQWEILENHPIINNANGSYTYRSNMYCNKCGFNKTYEYTTPI